MREEHKKVDAETLLEFFSMEKEKNPAFYFDYELGGANRLIKCFWTDPYARRSYNCFGDIIVFNTTYNTNKYDMIFAPITNVNYHGQTIIFGCAFLSDEKTESFVWLFNKFLDAMPKGAPQVIITDQDPAMTKAIVEALPLIVHWYCIWHILNKFSEKLGAIIYHDNYNLFKNVILNSETKEEFEASWFDLLKKISLDTNAWLCHLYEILNKWVPAYVNMHFRAGMSSSQRAESSHSFLKKYISRKNSLMDFITRFSRAVGHQ